MSSNDNYQNESSQTSHFFGRLNNAPPEKKRRDQSTLRATALWWKETVGIVIHAACHNGRSKAKRTLPIFIFPNLVICLAPALLLER